MSVLEKEFVLTHVFDNIPSMKENEKCFGDEEEHFTFPWKIFLVRKKDRLSFYVKYPRPLDLGKSSIKMKIFLKLIPANGINFFNISKLDCYAYYCTAEFTSRGWSDFVRWKVIEDNYIIGGKIAAEVHVCIQNLIGVNKDKWRTIDKSIKELTDIVLIVENEKFHVSKLFLTCKSSYFMSQFSGSFKKSEITLTGVNPKHFLNFLKLLHGEPVVNEETVEGILHIAVMYHAHSAAKRCEGFLVEKSKKSLIEKLGLATKYNLVNLKETSLAKIKNIDDIRSVVPANLEHFDHSVMAALFEKALSQSF